MVKIRRGHAAEDLKKAAEEIIAEDEAKNPKKKKKTPKTPKKNA